ncbi:3-dehydroquinate synthase [Lachnospiraceae bacterium XBB1006]|nr:3-dehydroquinate synthase [Lachnospiraceae bacterium XBB1006]
MDIIKIRSKLYDYTVEFVADVLPLIEGCGEETTFVISKNVYSLYSNIFEGVNPSVIYIMDDVESNKNMDAVMEIIGFWKAIGVKKNWKVYCFGGGITQDVTTIASNLYLRNIDWFFFPTTLLAMCDSCIGGKCGINYGQYKNQIGVFYPPKKIYIDVKFLNTLTQQDYLNGWGEILKFSLTRYPDFYKKLKAETKYIPCEGIASYIHRGLLVKKEVIEEDEFESDLRRILNYGHTFGHALEAYTENQIPHGEGVIWGIDVVNYIATREGLIENDYYKEIKKLIRQAFIREEIVIEEPERLFDIISTDKKVRGNEISLAILDKPSNLIVYPMKLDEHFKQMFYDYIEETHEYYSN